MIGDASYDIVVESCWSVGDGEAGGDSDVCVAGGSCDEPGCYDGSGCVGIVCSSIGVSDNGMAACSASSDEACDVVTCYVDWVESDSYSVSDCAVADVAEGCVWYVGGDGPDAE